VFGQAADVTILQTDDEHLDERLVRWAEGDFLVAMADQHSSTSDRYERAQLVAQSRLADAGFANQHHECTMTCRGILKRRAKLAQFIVATHQRYSPR
jgi:hypothetical protein